MTEETTTPVEETKATKATSTKKTNNEEVMEKHNQMIQFVKNTISTIETDKNEILNNNEINTNKQNDTPGSEKDR